ncbi:hypothetical protein V1L54_24495 [Streptomyces sp. TRM 70361]|uniref:hypothetical protein n=1 Tax=Streptomyces sp. TRM 70361 TaxID=3116553 RepID=UPI002E7B90EE|nr:hypothetical protein [Streptomyces sp. TRM 70361]MEE1942524.1 hypothetical protein [Streptomyces sp. TRM 70361]
MRREPTMHTTLRVLERLEGLLLSGEQRTARRNAWNAVLEDRRRARARGEAAARLEAAATGARRAT